MSGDERSKGTSRAGRGDLRVATGVLALAAAGLVAWWLASPTTVPPLPDAAPPPTTEARPPSPPEPPVVPGPVARPRPRDCPVDAPAMTLPADEALIYRVGWRSAQGGGGTGVLRVRAATDDAALVALGLSAPGEAHDSVGDSLVALAGAPPCGWLRDPRFAPAAPWEGRSQLRALLAAVDADAHLTDAGALGRAWVDRDGEVVWLALVGRERAPAPDVDPGAFAPDAPDAEALLADMPSIDAVVADLVEGVPATLEAPEWRERAVGALRSRPGRAHELVAAVVERSSSDLARVTTARLLAAVGNREAQSALERLAGHSRVVDTPAFVAIVPAFAGLERPSDDTVGFLLERLEWKEPKPTAEAREALALALGALVGRILPVRDSSVANDVLDRLADRLSRAQDDDQRVVFLDALGAVGTPAVVGAIAAYRDAPSDAVRGSAIRALRGIDTPEVTRWLLAAVSDRAPAVARVALEILAPRPLDADGYAALTRAVRAAAVLAPALDPLVDVVAATPPEHAEAARALIDAVTGRADAPAPVRAAMQQMRSFMESTD